MTDKTKRDLELLRFKRSSLMKKVTTLHQLSLQIVIESDDNSDFEVRFGKLENNYEAINRCQAEIVKNLIALGEEDQIEREEKAIEQLDEMYFRILATHKRLHDKNLNQTVSLQPQSQQQVRLPKIDLPTFSGNLKDWPHFRDMFVSLIHNNEKLPEVEKFHYLVSCLRSEPLSLAKTLPMTAQNYSIIWNQLKDRYDNKRLLATCYLEEILNAPCLPNESPKKLRQFLDLFTENFTALCAMRFPVDYGDFILSHVILQKLDKHTRQLFERKYSAVEFPTYENMVNFLKDHCKSLEAASLTENGQFSPGGASKPKAGQSSKFLGNKTSHSAPTSAVRHSFLSTNPQPQNCKHPCLYCNENHFIYRCPSFSALPVNERRDFIKKKQACFNCLSHGHASQACISSTVCKKCSRKHHTMLHESPPSPMSSTAPPSTPVSRPAPTQPSTTLSSSTSAHAASHLESSGFTTLLGTAAIQVQDLGGIYHTVRALLDPGSQMSFISEDCVNRLSLPRKEFTASISGISESNVNSSKGLVTCVIKPRFREHPRVQASAAILNTITAALPAMPLPPNVKAQFSKLELADPYCDVPGKVDFLIGADLYPEVCDGGRLKSPAGYPTPFRTIFGWVLLGKTACTVPSTYSKPIVLSNLSVTQAHNLQQSLRKFWEIEELPQNKAHISPEDERCESIYLSTFKHTPSGRFEVNLPFKNDPPNIGDSYDRAKGCLLSLEKKFKQNPEFKSAYCSFMEEYKDLGHMKLVEGSEKQAYYIPHHGIFKSNSQTAKLRVVFNASSPSSSGRSLNDELLVGPKLQTDICKILSLFRLHSYVFTTDIEKMYRQILVNPQQIKYQTILWRDSPEKPISTFHLSTVTYGVSSSPFLALRTLHQLTADHAEQFPLASEVVLNSMFVDDVLTGGDSLEIVQKVKSELISLLSLGGFKLRKWSSNSLELLKDVPAHHQELIFQEDKLDNPSIKVLGLKWNPVSDVFSYEVHVGHIPMTKRNILSQISKVYDPLGLITPIVLWAKCLIQRLWILGLEWDQMPPPDIISQSNKFFEKLPQLSKLAITRQVVLPDFVEVQLHGFCDASELGYGCAVYLRTVDKDKRVSVKLLMAKSKVAPLKKISIPRLELCGAVLLGKTMNFCQDILHSKLGIIPAFAWSDSLVALHWIRTAPHQLKTFVANRVSELQSYLEPANWRHTPATTNPADYASRGLQPDEIIHNSLWFHGPEWLHQDRSAWPQQPTLLKTPDESLIEFKPSTSHVGLVVDDEKPTNDTIKLIETFSNFHRLQSCLGWILRFINNVRKSKEKVDSPYLTAKERLSSLNLLVKLTQAHHFPAYCDSVPSKQPFSPSHQRLNPFLDKEGILRVGGRIEKAELSYNLKHPMLLPKKSHLTYLLIDHFHVVGPRSLQSLLSRQFWIISARQVIRHRLSKCLICTKLKGNSLQPYMGNLPAARLKQTRPFLNVGVDFGGPFMTKSDKLRKPQTLKSYVCLFICFSTKAIHLELVSSLSTEAFLACLDRFVSRRGLCSNIYSDQATNFIGADRELKDLYNLLSKPETSNIIFSKLSSLGISWHFNPPAAPHFGGLWESGIKSTKYHLKRVLGNQVLTFEEFSTLLAKVEAILNSRPLCSLSSDPNEFETLTPGHFLIGEPLVAMPQSVRH